VLPDLEPVDGWHDLAVYQQRALDADEPAILSLVPIDALSGWNKAA
jgi:hypothetical protein